MVQTPSCTTLNTLQTLHDFKDYTDFTTLKTIQTLKTIKTFHPSKARAPSAAVLPRYFLFLCATGPSTTPPVNPRG